MKINEEKVILEENEVSTIIKEKEKKGIERENEKKILVKEIKKIGTQISYDYEIDRSLVSLLHMDNKLKIDYSIPIEDVPDEIAVIPFITGILPMIYLEDITVVLDRIDKDFYEAFDQIREGYKKMLPKGEWKGKIEAKEIIDHSKNPENGKSSVFFSGGVDSTSSLATHIKEKPEFILIWGSDILQNNEKSWETAKQIAQNTADQFGINTNYISSNFRFYLNENALTTKYRELLPVSWWYDVQHGAALLGHVAPIAYKKKLAVHYIPSSYNIHDKNVVCASYPTLDEKMKFCGCHIIHDGFEMTRLEKVKNICDFQKDSKPKITLRVCCTEREEEANCCKCEKCYRTIGELIACKEDPKKFGFPITEKEIRDIKKFFKKEEVQGTAVRHWKEIQNKMLEDQKYFKKLRYAKWIMKFNFDKTKRKDFKKEMWDENGEKI
ncbi:MAG TPA: hypothetical protein IAB70_05205 [Candidatus Merdicola faecigallinarum]|uniref:Uncharacterized protein n=1 Tax=Candidatus Merdicola faecigallinarum TaxID=2840862 RepID=A0A9D1SA30_9FIRM|nr:hypothetical protein [Candidatus Merdicola faecigallinarum]